MLEKRSIVGLYTDENTAADALDALNSAGYETNEYEILTGTPYPEGTFGEHEPEHKLYRWPLAGRRAASSSGWCSRRGRS